MKNPPKDDKEQAGQNANVPPQQTQPVPVYFASYPPEEDEINLLDYWKVLVKNKKLIGIITGASTTLALLAAFLMTPIYRAETLLAPVQHEGKSGLSALAGQFGGLAELAGVNLGSGSNTVEETIATLRSRALADVFIKEQKIMPILFPDKWDAKKKKWKKKGWGLSDEEDRPTAWAAFEIFDKGIRSVRVDRKTGLVTLAIEWKDPALTEKWANNLVKRVNAQRREEAIRDAEKSIAYLEKEITKTSSVEVQQSIYRLIEAQTKTIMVANTREEYAFKVIDPAVVPEEKAKPKRRLIVILGFITGLMIGVFSAFFRRFLENQGIKSKDTGE